MSARGGSVRTDVQAREAIDRVGLAVAQRDGTIALEACDMLDELARAGYRMRALSDPSAITARPVRIRAAYDGMCASCGAPIAIDDAVYWTRGASGVQCSACGGA